MLGKKFLVLSLVLLGVAALAADYMDSFSAYRSQIRRALGVDVTNTTYLSDSTANEFLREGVMTVTPQIGGDRSIDTTFRTAFWKSNYKLDTFTMGVRAVAISKNDTTKGLLYVPMSLWYQQEHKTTTGQQDNYLKRPSYWDYFDNTLWIYPPPTIAGDTLRIFTWKKPRYISDTTNLTALHPMARLAVLKYAIWQAAQARQHPMAGAFKSEYDVALFNAKNTIDGGIGVQNPTGSTPTGK